jgi:hypothetical protein
MASKVEPVLCRIARKQGPALCDIARDHGLALCSIAQDLHTYEYIQKKVPSYVA